MRYCSFFIVPFLILLLLTACWDSESIEDRGFIIGTAIDLAEQKNNETILFVTNQLVIPFNVQSTTTGGSSGEEPYINISAQGKSLYQIDQEMAKLTNKLPFFEHTKVLIISEEIARTPHLLSSLLDIYIRSPEMRRGIHVVVTKKAKQLLESEPKAEKLPSIYIDELLNTGSEKAGLYRPKSIGDIQEEILRNSSFVLPILSPVEKRIEYTGGAVFHGHKSQMIDTLTNEEVTGLNLVIGNSKSGTLEINYKDSLITVDIKNIHNKLKIDPSNLDDIKVTIQIKMTATIEEIFGKENLQTDKNLPKIEEAFSNHMQTLVKMVFEKGKSELNADIFQLDKVLESRHPKIWKKIKKDWDHGENYFSNTTLELNVETNIRTTGAVIQTKK